MQNPGMDAELSDALHMEFLALRSSIRKDLQEELQCALAPGGTGAYLFSKSSSRPQSRGAPGFTGSAKQAAPRETLRHVDFNYHPATSDDVEVLRLVGNGGDVERESMDGPTFETPSVLQLHIPTDLPQRKVGFADDVSELASESGFEQGEIQVPPAIPRQPDSIAEKRRKSVGNFLHESVMSAVKRAKMEQTRPTSAPRTNKIFKSSAPSKKTIKQTLRKGLTASALSRQSKQEATTRSEDEALKFEEVFELVTLVAIVLNGVMFGVQTEYQSNERTEDLPVAFVIMEVIFFCIFTIELILRFSRERSEFCTGSNSAWNFFDTFLVCLQVFDVILETTQLLQDMANLSFLRLLRILRILRALRLVRLVRFFGELNVVTSAIANSIKSLSGTVALLLLIIYIFSIAFAGAANSYLIELIADGTNTEDNPVQIWWSSFGRTVLSLYESILGGVDWDDLVKGLFQIHSGWVFLFLGYISFMMLTMLNVITGIFVDSAVKHAAQYQEKTFASQMRSLFVMTDTDNAGILSRGRFETEMKKPEFAWFMQEVGIEPREARLLFDLLDLDKSDDIELEEFLAGMVRLRAGARFIDLMNLQHAIEHELQGEQADRTATLAPFAPSIISTRNRLDPSVLSDIPSIRGSMRSNQTALY